jgi:hypothetical protein
MVKQIDGRKMTVYRFFSQIVCQANKAASGKLVTEK